MTRSELDSEGYASAESALNCSIPPPSTTMAPADRASRGILKGLKPADERCCEQDAAEGRARPPVHDHRGQKPPAAQTRADEYEDQRRRRMTPRKAT